ncbi:unnamed protein product [Clonostachys rosea f. rosea IK726]|uniref:Uncharacterized protein n=1 Tax=Clonostachys rosea f. rosea IK726 TaxID=1349383 RepID=A0ACA9TGD8_BIOOC|nr:unnamed protein product [Clonostachys rosea f. rosea IK726]
MQNESEERLILALVTTGGFTHAEPDIDVLWFTISAPVLDVCQALAKRGHTVDFATLDGQENWVKNYPFIRRVHSLGPGPTEEQYREHWSRMLKHDAKKGVGSEMWESKYLWDSFFPITYKGLRKVCIDPETRPSFIIADFFAELAAKDMMAELGIPIAIMWPQMPFLLAPASYIPGQPGFQAVISTTSEHASLMSRLKNELVMVCAMPSFLVWLRWLTALRKKAGVRYPSPIQLTASSRPLCLVLVNSFFGLETPKDLPPLMAPVGPILADEFPTLDQPHGSFLDSHNRTAYVALGTHINLTQDIFDKLFSGLVQSLSLGHIDGIIWSLPARTRENLYHEQQLEVDGELFSLGDLLDNKASSVFFPTYSPQRAVLDHKNATIFVTHAGGSSANEVAYHGKPALVIPFMFDQLCNAVRLEEAGIGLRLDKFDFTQDEVTSRIALITEDEDGTFARNVLRLRRIARVAARRKHLAADLVEEVLYDDELRRGNKKGVASRPMHLETADVRLSWFKKNNWDLYLFTFGTFVGLPLASAYGIHYFVKARGIRQLMGVVSHVFFRGRDIISPVISQK